MSFDFFFKHETYEVWTYTGSADDDKEKDVPNKGNIRS